MKKLLVFGFIISLFSTVSFAQDYITSKQLLVDTSKLENFSFYLEQNREMRKNRTVFNPSDDEVRSWYFNGDSITERSLIEYYRSINRLKLVSYPVNNVDIFNKIFNGVDMLFEYSYNSSSEAYFQALFAKYKGRYHTVFYFNQLLENMGLNEQVSVEEKIECIINWKYWLWDQSIELLDIEQTKEQMPYDTIMHHRISLDTEERIAVNVHNDYKAEYFGHILFEGRELEFYAHIVGDKKFIKAIFLFEPGTKDTIYEDNNKNLLYNITLNFDNYNYENNDRSDIPAFSDLQYANYPILLTSVNDILTINHILPNHRQLLSINIFK